MSTPAAAFARLLETFDRLEVGYLVGGSVASSAHGVPRTTLDVDLVVDLKAEQIQELAAELGNEFYVDAGMIREAFARGRAANVIHLATAWKFDLFPLGVDAYSRTAFGRRLYREIRPDGREGVECAVATAEDTVLRKLECCRARGETSQCLWEDLRGIVKAAGRQLDAVYLRKWAGELKVDDLLEKLLVEAGN